MILLDKDKLIEAMTKGISNNLQPEHDLKDYARLALEALCSELPIVDYPMEAETSEDYIKRAIELIKATTTYAQLKEMGE